MADAQSATGSNGNSTLNVAQPQIQEPADLKPLYSNFARVAGTPEEVVVDFGLDPMPFSNTARQIKISERVVMNYYTAKRLWAALGASLQRFEQAFGPLEIDVSKRAKQLPETNRNS
ncbi:hypothetical protein Spb1_05130 [Planctopirus ephydatiae]|jgi:hypothetical protein|uniref:DUF3467 domain-containing protein n=1 Tax=Planctopirus ephydatiae TaxID=2528019 RepID=A0A518GJ77_9PLAN|nr:DUF3467 domain-containing protein [Planctopirus ephydatiae]QDV28649.1 hypothetical protein Spb1_05130 [Planctopirus ephydatiae]